MKTRILGRTGATISEIGFGAWQIGGSWGDVSEEDGKRALNAALDSGITFIDTADVYGDGRSEKIIAAVLQERGGEKPFVATKAGRRLNPHLAEGYTGANIEAFIDRSLANLGVETLDLVQLHCPPTEVYYRPEVFGALDRLVTMGKIRHYGVSVEKVEEALKAIEYPGVATVQIIYNIFRQRPQDLFFAEAKKKDVGVVVRVPLASGLLSGKISKDTVFAADDHRNFNRHGEAFDVGETFAGVPFDVALQAVDELRTLAPANVPMAQFALRWILAQDAVSVVIPGARNAAQAQSNAAASALAPIDGATLAAIAALYERLIKVHVHQRW
ncbi:aldo/keto reductase [Sinorhizobium meliloti]|uniref:aldo/keto reductase n=1 Tax=Rhizobium meliloti TaxID=382 RepID=UPI0001E4DD03|nr:aldo/keto reductase [Sinorhizobium meliloti]TWA88930.1 aryl-alcohol dehydrogenase-like predicted oxidoreductase [Ensifer sp. SEMIA 134]TWB24357.1 aryl-alcohol dehydrogenase-like predicted oxidoreductase [Ensifer sp. SEMIA 135]AEG03046.1 NADP-dependent oxidoreductase domain protein [Sinorhizobium meliloti BL225C]AGA05449.1 putative oxidoreductases (related to aryl-alcohol dehydrogenases) [Sinorhizobium meliloti GR4]AIL98316.1 aldo/keto reductase [Sinorhizobium meliloti]